MFGVTPKSWDHPTLDEGTLLVIQNDVGGNDVTDFWEHEKLVGTRGSRSGVPLAVASTRGLGRPVGGWPGCADIRTGMPH